MVGLVSQWQNRLFVRILSDEPDSDQYRLGMTYLIMINLSHSTTASAAASVIVASLGVTSALTIIYAEPAIKVVYMSVTQPIVQEEGSYAPSGLSISGSVREN